MDRGRVVVDGTLDDVRAGYRRIQLVFGDVAPDHVFTARGVINVRRNGRVVSVLSSGGEEGVVAEARALSPVSVDVHPVTLKEIFLEAVGVEN